MTRYDGFFEFLPAAGRPSPEKFVTFGFKKHLGISGFQKLVNTWLKALLTEQGTDLSDLEYGTAFSRLFGSNITTQQDVRDIIELSVLKASRDVERYQAIAPPADTKEIFGSVTVQSLSFTQDGLGVSITVLLENALQDRMSLLIPTPLSE